MNSAAPRIAEAAPELQNGDLNSAVHSTPAAAYTTLFESKLDHLRLRAWSRAYMLATCQIDNMPDAVDPLWFWAEQGGLVRHLGVDALQAVLAAAISAGTSSANPAGGLSAERITSIKLETKQAARSTPQVVIEAVMYSVRERGLSALHEADTLERLRRCDNAARQQIERRLAKLFPEAAE